MTKYLSHSVLLVFLLTISGCQASSGQLESIAEPIHSMTLTPKSLILQVTSNGCTRKEHFELKLQPTVIPQLAVVRTKKDTCRRKRFSVELEFSLSDLAIDPKVGVVVANPLKAFSNVKFK